MPTYHRTKSQIESEQLEILAAQKDARQFGVIYERYYDQIFLFVLKRVNDETFAADVTSQVFLKTMLNLKKYRFKGLPFSAWLYRIAINEVNQFFRDTKNQRAVSMESSQLADIMEEVEESSDETGMQRMLATLDSLSPDEIQMVELRYFEKMPFKEIALIYNITENNAKVRMYRILGKMKKKMGSVKVN